MLIPVSWISPRLLKSAGSGRAGLIIPGTGLLIVGLGFKLSLVPFHMWTPDVYEGAPAPITGFLASVSKGAVFALMLRYFTRVDIHTNNSLVLVFTVIAVASMFGGNLLALMQNHVKRVLAYSSIAHFGYLLTAFLASGSLAVTCHELLSSRLFCDHSWGIRRNNLAIRRSEVNLIF